MFEERFIEGDSYIHRLDPRVKSIVAATFSIVVAVSNRFTALIPALIISMTLIIFARISFQKVIARLLIVNGFILLLWFMLPFTTAGSPLFSIGPFTVTGTGIHTAALITLKSNAIILALMALTATMSVFTMGRALGDLHVPSKVVHLIFLTYRYVHVIYQEYNRLIKAVKIRGFRPHNNIHTYRTYAYLLGMLFVKSYDRAEQVRAAMLCRGFQGKFYDLKDFELKASDLVIMVLMLMSVSAIVVLQWL